jgi:hypothetical protein
MHLDSETWSCRRCGAAFIGGKPADLICAPCATGHGFDVVIAAPSRLSAPVSSQVVLTVAEQGCLRDMFADAVAFRLAREPRDYRQVEAYQRVLLALEPVMPDDT